MNGSSALLQAAWLWERRKGRVNGHTHTLFFQDGSSTQPRRQQQPRQLSNASDPERWIAATNSFDLHQAMIRYIVDEPTTQSRLHSAL
jgi:hypothetical protein